jgi:ATPase subunit of ABC transporter with duplicated ATPase domains
MVHLLIREKSLGSRPLLKNFELRLADGEKLGFIGRNGSGKTTVFRILCGEDSDFDGDIRVPSTQTMLATSQEHHHVNNQTVRAYITSRLPDFTRLKTLIDELPHTMGENARKQAEFADALELFSTRGYYDIENEIESYFDDYQLSPTLLDQPFPTLSGGQKRLVDLVAIQIANPSIALLDEPTNHMDFIAKEKFIAWLKSTDSDCVVISHDRDVLQAVDRIVELKDTTLYSYPGNYDAYIAQNSTKTVGAMQGYESTEKRIENLRDQIRFANAKARSQAGQQTGRSGKNKWVVLRDRYEKELEHTMATHKKPEFWIDQDSANKLPPKITEKYEKYKAKNIRLHRPQDRSHGLLLQVEKLSLGYDARPLFENLSFDLRGGEKLHIVGRNGAGKTTLVRAIFDTVNGIHPSTVIGKGLITPAPALSVRVYEQELARDLLEKTLFDSIEQSLRERDIPAHEQAVRAVLAQYLFDPIEDATKPVSLLSGGQKARLQLIRLLIGNPGLLILDEPTNHLDLPSIEELEKALSTFSGAILYISHDSYFARNLGGVSIRL